MREAASGFERFSNLLRDPNLDEVATLISNLGRKQPATIVAGVVLIGLGLSWYPEKFRRCDPPHRTCHYIRRRLRGRLWHTLKPIGQFRPSLLIW